MSFVSAPIKAGEKAGSKCSLVDVSVGVGEKGPFDVDRVQNTMDRPMTCFSAGSFRPISSDGRAKTGLLSSQEQLNLDSSIAWNLEQGKKAFEELVPEKGTQSMDAQIVRHCTKEVEMLRQIEKTFGRK